MDRTRYSDKIEGDRGNYKWGGRFDIATSGYLGITQEQDGGAVDRILLSPKQVKALLAFVAKKPQRS